MTEYIPQRACLLASETVSLLQRRLPETPAPLLHPLLSAVFCHQVEQEPLIQGIIVAHGLTTASSIAGTANNLLAGFYLKAFDMPLSVDTRGIISHLTTWIDGLKEQAGMVILVDMGSLEDIYAEIKLHIQGDLLVMNNVSTAMALDIAEKIQQRLSMKEIVDGIKGAWEIEALYYSGIVQGNKLIISCISGEGVSKQLQEIARRYVNDETLDVVTMEYDDLKWKLAKADSALYGTRLIITTTELNANAIPIINVRKLIGDKPDQLWKNYFSTIMSADRLKQMVDEIVILFTIEGVASHLSFLNTNVIIEEVEEVVKFYEMTYNIHFESYLRINLFMHLAAMIERLMTHEVLNHREDSELTDQQRHFIALTPQAFRPLIAKYRFAMTTTECLMICELMEPWITVDHSLLVLNAQRDSVQVSGDA
ncbi:Transcriptional regulatory protein DagR [Sodalis praecaptivus]|nr:Transcriptional regulatory protein DagR [Sodalis praecaptivus]